MHVRLAGRCAGNCSRYERAMRVRAIYHGAILHELRALSGTPIIPPAELLVETLLLGGAMKEGPCVVCEAAVSELFVCNVECARAQTVQTGGFYWKTFILAMLLSP